MQSSSSFELARNGRKRPDNLSTPREFRSDMPLPSPSFNPEHRIRNTNDQSPFNGSPWKKTLSPARDDLPPTPITAGMPQRRPSLKLPGIQHMLASVPVPHNEPSSSSSSTGVLTPPRSNRMPALPRLGSEEQQEQFNGQRPQWVQDAAPSAFVDVARPALSRNNSASTVTTTPASVASSQSLTEMVRNEEESGVIGLGFDMSEATPRLGGGGSTFGMNTLGLSTPTQDDYMYMPRAPIMAQEGVFASMPPSSPLQPPLDATSWNQDLHFEAIEFVAPLAPLARSPRSVPMVREQQVSFEGTGAGMPMQSGVWGLGISLDGSDLPALEASTSTVPIADVAMSSPSSSSLTVGDKFRARLASTGLTPTLNISRISDINDRGLDSPASPSLRTKSKMRSNLVRREAEAAAAAATISRQSAASPSSSRSSPPIAPSSSPLGSDSDGSSSTAMPASMGSESIPTPRKRTLSARDTNLPLSSSSAPASMFSSSKSTKSTKQSRSASSTTNSNAAGPSSPWGVFRLKDEGWKALGPPGGGRGVGASVVKKVGSSSSSSTSSDNVLASAHAEQQIKKQKRIRTAPSGLDDGEKRMPFMASGQQQQQGGVKAAPRHHVVGGDENKENVVPLYTSAPHDVAPNIPGSKVLKRPSANPIRPNHGADVFGSRENRPTSASSSSSSSSSSADSRRLSATSTSSRIQQRKRSPFVGIR